MSSLNFLLSVEIEHDYFTHGVLSGLAVEPLPATRAFLDRAGLLLRRVPKGMKLYSTRDGSELLKLLLDDSGGRVSLFFGVLTNDVEFGNYTESETLGLEEPLACFSSARNQRQGGPTLLHSGATAATGDVGSLNVKRASEALGSQKSQATSFSSVNGLRESDQILLHSGKYAKALDIEQLRAGRVGGQRGQSVSVSHRHPDFFIEVALQLGSTVGSNMDPARYVLRFGSRQTYWTYYLLGDMVKRQVDVVDVDGNVEFEELGRRGLSDGREALAFRSRTAISLQQRSSCRFQLRESPSGKILVRCLPAAAAALLNREKLGEQTVSISEMYVNL